MSLSAPVGRFVPRCLFRQNLPVRARPRQVAVSGRRAASSDSPHPPHPNPVLEEFRRNNPDIGQPPPAVPGQMPKQGDIASSSIFEDDRRIHEQRGEQDAQDGEGKTHVGGITRDPDAIKRVLIPDPASRERWERKKVIQMVKKGGRLSKREFLKRTEREHLVRSHNMKTSVKKLGKLARQIAGKTVDDAIVQMRFSKKKVAQEVLKQLEFARDEAVVMRGMGLKTAAPDHAPVLHDSSTHPAPTSSTAVEPAPGGPAPRVTPRKPLEIRLRDGKRHRVEDASTIYIDQAWVGRGPYGKLRDYRARGVSYIMRTPWTSLSVVLKEEQTRIREHEEREAKRRKKMADKVWVPLPDRPIQTHRQWYSW